jgi:hypothetical protein
MKKLLPIAIFVLSINAFAQGKQLLFGKQHTIANDQTEVLTPSHPENRNELRVPKPLYDSVYYWQWDSVSLAWKIYSKTINIIYDTNNNWASNLDQIWTNGVWVNKNQNIYTYDANNNKINKLVQEWSNSAWLYSYQYTYTYDAKNNRTSYLFQRWTNGAWVNSYQHTLSYDVHNNWIGELSQNWTNGAWVNRYQLTNTYDTNNNQIGELDQTWNNGAWVNNSKATYTYDANNNETGYYYQRWSNGVWVDNSKANNTYDANNNLIGRLHQTWTNGTWVDNSKDTYTYDANSFMKSYTNKYWNTTGTKITSGDSSYYYFHTATDINDLLAGDKSMLIYPCPFSSQTTIYFTEEQHNSTITITDVLGKAIKTINFTGKQFVLDKGEMKGGVYFVRVMDANKNVINKKIVVQ